MPASILRFQRKWFRCAPLQFAWIVCSAHCVHVVFVLLFVLLLFTYYLSTYLYTHIYVYIMRSKLFPIESHALTAESKWISHRWRYTVCSVSTAQAVSLYVRCTLYINKTQQFSVFFFFFFFSWWLDLATSLRFVSVSLFICRYSKNPFKAAAHIMAATENQ